MSQSARRAIADEQNNVLISAASAWEITTKHRLGKLPEAKDVALDVTAEIAHQGFEELPITVDEAARAASLPGLHRGPIRQAAHRAGTVEKSRASLHRTALRSIRSAPPLVTHVPFSITESAREGSW